MTSYSNGGFFNHAYHDNETLEIDKRFVVIFMFPKTTCFPKLDLSKTVFEEVLVEYSSILKNRMSSRVIRF